MPVMDGLQAARAIRAVPRGANTPILAMTANAFEEDRQRCLLAGMNDHIAKPVEIGDLYAHLIKWLPVRHGNLAEDDAEGVARPDSAAPPGAPSDSDAARLLRDVGGLDVEFGLRSMLGDVRHYARLLRLFHMKHAGDGEGIRGLLRSGDLPGVRNFAHALKGASGTLGLVELQRLAGRLEQVAAASEAPAIVTACAEELFRELERVMTALARVLPQIPAPEALRAAEASPAQVGELLDRLEAMLARNDASAIQLFDAVRGELIRACGDAARAIEPLIQNFDFADALKALRRLKR
jgi:CheY-like chemotaxis protein